MTILDLLGFSLSTIEVTQYLFVKFSLLSKHNSVLLYLTFGLTMELLCEFFKQKDTTYQHFCIYTPQQNGIVEHRHRHINLESFTLKPIFLFCFLGRSSISTARSLSLIVYPRYFFLNKPLLNGFNDKIPTYSYLLKVFQVSCTCMFLTNST